MSDLTSYLNSVTSITYISMYCLHVLGSYWGPFGGLRSHYILQMASKSKLTSDLEFVAQIAYATMLFGLLWPLLDQMAERKKERKKKRNELTSTRPVGFFFLLALLIRFPDTCSRANWLSRAKPFGRFAAGKYFVNLNLRRVTGPVGFATGKYFVNLNSRRGNSESEKWISNSNSQSQPTVSFDYTQYELYGTAWISTSPVP